MVAVCGVSAVLRTVNLGKPVFIAIIIEVEINVVVRTFPELETEAFGRPLFPP